MLFISMYNFSGKIRNIKFLIKDTKTVRVWKPKEASLENFRPQCDLIIKYIMDEGFYKKKSCRVEIIS
jgi:hypothetical protein